MLSCFCDRFAIAEIALGHRVISKTVHRERSLAFLSKAQDVKQIHWQPDVSEET